MNDDSRFGAEDFNPHPDTIAFSCLPLSVAMMLPGIHFEMARFLKWKHTARALLDCLLFLLVSEPGPVGMSYEDLSEILFPSLSKKTGIEKTRRWVLALEQDQMLSKYQAVRITGSRTQKTKEGRYYTLPRQYQVKQFPELLAGVQMKVAAGDLFNELEGGQMRARFSTMVHASARELGFEPIPAGVHKKPKKESLMLEPSSKAEKERLRKIIKGARRNIDEIQSDGLDEFERALTNVFPYLDNSDQVKWYAQKLYRILSQVENDTLNRIYPVEREIKNAKIKKELESETI